MTATIALPDYSSAAYLEAYSRINAMVIVGEGLADRHFRLLADAIPEDAESLQVLAAMEGRHARDFVGCGVHLGVKPDVPLARSLFAPLHALFLKASRAGDRVACLVIQCLIVESFAVAAYRCYLPVADAYARPITAEVLKDEALHLSYGEDWLRPRFQEVAEEVVACCRRAVPVALGMLERLKPDLDTIGIAPVELVGEFMACFQESLVAIGFSPARCRQVLTELAAAALA
jgi:fatty aldehyde decarbonylase